MHRGLLVTGHEPGPAAGPAARPGGTPPDLLLRTFEPPQMLVRGTDLVTLLTPAYQRLAAPDEPAGG